MAEQMEHFSKSALEKYVNCGEAYKRRYILEEKTTTSSNLVFGIAFHNALEEYVRQHTNGNENFDLLNFWEATYNAELAAHGAILFEDNSPEEALDLGRRMLTSYDVVDTLNQLAPMKITKVNEEGEYEDWAIEMKLEFPIPGVEVPFVGYIDLLMADGIPLDFKTSARKWSADKAQKELQPAFYIYGLAAMGMPVPDNKFRHMIITKGKNPAVELWETTRSEQELKWAMRLAALSYQGIQAGVFVPNPTSWLCSASYCEFYASCMASE